MTVGRRALLVLPVVFVAVADGGPLLAMLLVSGTERFPAPPGQAPGFGLGAYRAVLAGPGYGAALGHSLLLAAGATAAALLLALPIAYHLVRHVPAGRRGRRLLLLAAPFWSGEVVRLSGLVLLLSGRGALNTALGWAGLGPVAWLYGPAAVLAGTAYTVFLVVLLPVYAALDRMPPALLDAARDLGARSPQLAWFVVLPLARRGIAAGCALGFLASLGLLSAPALLGGAGTPAFANLVAAAFTGASGQWPLGAALGTLLLAAGLAGAALLLLPGGWTARKA